MHITYDITQQTHETHTHIDVKNEHMMDLSHTHTKYGPYASSPLGTRYPVWVRDCDYQCCLMLVI